MTKNFNHQLLKSKKDSREKIKKRKSRISYYKFSLKKNTGKQICNLFGIRNKWKSYVEGDDE